MDKESAKRQVIIDITKLKYWQKGQNIYVMNSENRASINDEMYWINQLATQKEGDACGSCFNPDTNFDCGKCVAGLECVEDPQSALLPDLPSRCRKPSGNTILRLWMLENFSIFSIHFKH